MRADAASGADQLHAASQVLREPLQRMSSLVNALQATITALNTGIEHANAAAQSTAVVVQAGDASIKQHQRFVEELTHRWPTLAKQYIETSDAAFAKVASSWKSQAEAIQKSVVTIGENFANSATDFAEAVSDLGDQLKKLQPGNGAPAARR